MLRLQIIFAVAASYLLCVSGQEEESCYEKIFETCGPSRYPEEVPTSVDQLRDICSHIKELGACILRVRESDCSGEANEKHAERLREILSYIHGVCKEDSEVFQAISSNLPCIATASENVFEPCLRFDFSDATKEFIVNTVMEYAEKSLGNETAQPGCLETLWFASCPSIKIGVKCGFEAGTAVKDVLINVNNDPMCSDEFIAKITPMLETIEVAITQDELLKMAEEEGEESPSVASRRKRQSGSRLRSLFR